MRKVTVWKMSCGALVSRPESYTQLASEVQWQVTALVLAGEAESTYSFSDSRSQILIALTAAQLQPCLTVGFILAMHSKYCLRNSIVLSVM